MKSAFNCTAESFVRLLSAVRSIAIFSDIFRPTMVGLAMLGLLWELDNGPDLLSDEPLLWMKKGVKHNQTCEARISEKHRCPDWKGRFSKACTGVISVTPSRQTSLSLVFPLSDTTSWRWLSKFPFTGILGFPGFPTCLYIHLPW